MEFGWKRWLEDDIIKISDKWYQLAQDKRSWKKTARPMFSSVLLRNVKRRKRINDLKG